MFSENKTAYLLLIITTLGWGCNEVFAKLAVGEVSPMLLVSIRWLITMVLLACLFWKKLQEEREIILSHWRYLFIIGTAISISKSPWLNIRFVKTITSPAVLTMITPTMVMRTPRICGTLTGVL